MIATTNITNVRLEMDIAGNWWFIYDFVGDDGLKREIKHLIQEASGMSGEQ